MFIMGNREKQGSEFPFKISGSSETSIAVCRDSWCGAVAGGLVEKVASSGTSVATGISGSLAVSAFLLLPKVFILTIEQD